MKKTLFLLTTVAMPALLFTGCNNDSDDPTPQGSTAEIYVDDSNSSSSKWHYISLATGEIVGSELKSADDGNLAHWSARKDWDIAINRYKVRTNSGASTSAGAKGGVFTFELATAFDKVEDVPLNAQFVEDQTVETPGMGGTTVEKRSEAYVVFVTAGDAGMNYDPTPVYIFRSANGYKYYKTLFTQYFDENGKSGHVKFKYTEVYKN
ncbi:MAG: HmuY family protein [Prevotellaceae bacterium]|jgi:hypothetical protein|nr:HmuY family protein [Prevotellaceae bacterium]